MYDYFDKHGKKFLAVVGALLTLVFLLPAGFGGRGGNGGSGGLGKIDGRRVDADAINGTQNILRSLDRLIVPDRTEDGRPREVPLPLAVFRDPLYRQFEQNPVLLYLLMQEADKAGAVPSDLMLDRYLAPPVKLRADKDREIELDKLNPAVKDGLRQDLRRMMSVVEYFRRAQAAIKISRPLVDDELARASQQVKVHAVAFNAADYQPQLPQPSAEEIRRQFDAYAAVAPVATDANPFGFGYQLPDRVAIQWLVVSDAEAGKAVEASKPAERWQEDAFVYYRRNGSEFQTEKSPTSQPTTRPFAAAQPDVMRSLRAPLIEQKKREVANRIVQQLNALLPHTATRPASTQSVLFSEPAYSAAALQGVADAVQKQTGVRPGVVAPAGLLSRADLARQPGLGKALLLGGAGEMASAPDYLFDAQSLFRPDATPTAATPTAGTLDPGQPSQVLLGGDGLYVARVVGIAKAQPAASIDDVKDQVARDVLKTNAFARAAEAAQAAIDKAATGGLIASTAAVQTSDWFGVPTDADTAPPARAGLSGAWAGRVVNPAFEALRGVKSPGGLPTRTVVKLRHDGVAVALEIFDVRTTLNTKDEPDARVTAGQAVARNLVTRAFVDDWFAFDNVSRRVGYVADAPAQKPGPADPRNPASPSNPANPFLPG